MKGCQRIVTGTVLLTIKYDRRQSFITLLSCFEKLQYAKHEDSLPLYILHNLEISSNATAKNLQFPLYNLRAKGGQVLKYHIFHQYSLAVKKMCSFKT